MIGGATNCAVDAAYVDWGSTDGPLATDPANNMVCGTVTISPWVHDSTTYTEEGNPDLYDVGDCDGSDVPSVQLSNAISTFQNGVSSREIDCSNGFQDACQAIEAAYACISGAVSVAQSTSPWPLPPASTAEEVDAFGGVIRSSAENYIGGLEETSVPGFSFSVINETVGVTGTILTIANAYNSCAP